MIDAEEQSYSNRVGVSSASFRSVFALIHRIKVETLAYNPRLGISHSSPDPVARPISTSRPFLVTTKGPPESPLHIPEMYSVGVYAPAHRMVSVVTIAEAYRGKASAHAAFDTTFTRRFCSFP